MDNIRCMPKKVIRKSDIVALISIAIILFINNRYFYIFPLKNTRYIDLIIIIILSLFILFVNKNIKYSFISEIVILYLIVLYTAILSRALLGQAMYYIFDANRFIIYYLLYFPLVYIFSKRNNIFYVKVLIKVFGFLYTIMIIIQYHIYPNVIFLKGVNFAYRLDGYRYFGGFPIVVMSFFLFIESFFKAKKMSTKLIVSAILGIEYYYVIYITKTRNLFFALSLAVIFLLLVQKKYRSYKKAMLITLILVVAIFLFKDYIWKLVELSVDDTTGTGEDRIIYINYVLDRIKNSYYLGFGLTSAQFTKITYHIHDDIGIFGYFFEFGVPGVIWYICVVAKFIIMTYRIYRIKPERSYLFIVYIAYTIFISLFNCVFNDNELLVYFIIILALLDCEYIRVIKLI